VTRVAIDLGSGDDATDSVVVDGTASNDRITVAGDDTGVAVDGLAAQVTINHAEPTDQLTVAALGGDDAIDASGLAAGAISLTLDGGPATTSSFNDGVRDTSGVAPPSAGHSGQASTQAKTSRDGSVLPRSSTAASSVRDCRWSLRKMLVR
jgi:hypothetical protein